MAYGPALARGAAEALEHHVRCAGVVTARREPSGPQLGDAGAGEAHYRGAHPGRIVATPPAQPCHVGVPLGDEHRAQRREWSRAVDGLSECDIEHDALLVELVEPQRG